MPSQTKRKQHRQPIANVPLTATVDPLPDTFSSTLSDDELRTRLDVIERIASGLPFATRRLLQDDFARLHYWLQLPPENYMIDRRRLRGVQGSTVRALYHHRIQTRQEQLRNIRVALGNVAIETAPLYTMAEAALLLNVSVRSLQNYLANGQGQHHGYLGTQRFTVHRITTEPVPSTSAV